MVRKEIAVKVAENKLCRWSRLHKNRAYQALLLKAEDGSHLEDFNARVYTELN